MAAERDEPELRQLRVVQALSDAIQPQNILLWNLSDAIMPQHNATLKGVTQFSRKILSFDAKSGNSGAA